MQNTRAMTRAFLLIVMPDLTVHHSYLNSSHHLGTISVALP